MVTAAGVTRSREDEPKGVAEPNNVDHRGQKHAFQVVLYLLLNTSESVSKNVSAMVEGK